MNDCCTTGFQWDGTPSGRESTLADNKAYITGNSKDRAIFIVHDALGWQLKNTRLLADHYAKEVGATVYLPDFFHGWAVDGKDISITVDDDNKVHMNRNEDFDWAQWFGTNGPDVRMPEVLACARKLREQYTWVGAVGFCWGGLVGFKLASKSNAGLFDCISIAHPGTPSEDDIRSISVPFQILAPEHDPTFPPEMKELCNKEIPKLGVDYVYHHFPGMVHGFATKCDEKNQREKKALEQAKNAVVYWMLTQAQK